MARELVQEDALAVSAGRGYVRVRGACGVSYAMTEEQFERLVARVRKAVEESREPKETIFPSADQLPDPTT
jgi:hypothetical protein